MKVGITKRHGQKTQETYKPHALPHMDETDRGSALGPWIAQACCELGKEF